MFAAIDYDSHQLTMPSVSVSRREIRDIQFPTLHRGLSNHLKRVIEVRAEVWGLTAPKDDNCG